MGANLSTGMWNTGTMNVLRETRIPAQASTTLAAETPAWAIRRGATRLLAAAGQAVVAELPLGNGRRADLVALDGSGRLSIVEIKSGRADFRADRKWHAYLDHCDRFYFAVAADFPRAILPAGEGLIVADRFTAEIVRPAPIRPLAGARRKALLIRFGHAAAARLQALLDPAAMLA